MKKIPSNHNLAQLSQLKEMFSLKQDITTQMICSAMIEKITKEFIEDVPFTVVSYVEKTIDDTTILDSIAFGNHTDTIIFGLSLTGCSHIKELLFLFLFYFLWYRIVHINNTICQNINKKLGDYFDVEILRKRTNTILFIFFLVLNRNLENAV